jgi:polar amino acid transport system substrate-binding protein
MVSPFSLVLTLSDTEVLLVDLKRGRIPSLALVLLLSLVVLVLLLSACSGGGTALSAPSNLLTAGVLTVGSDPNYPPQEHFDPTTKKAVGFDIDLITEMAKLMSLQVKIVATKFENLLDDLAAKRFDVAISAMTITAQRQQKADFVPYLNVGESLLVEKGNPKHVKSTDDLCGLAVGVQEGTIEQGVLQSSSDNCLEQEKPEITIISLQDQIAVIELLTQHHVIATYQDSPVTDYYAKQNASRFEVAGSVFAPSPQGIAVRKNDTEMLTAIQAAYKQVKTAGTYHQLVLKWGLANAELTVVDRRRTALWA